MRGIAESLALLLQRNLRYKLKVDGSLNGYFFRLLRGYETRD